MGWGAAWAWVQDLARQYGVDPLVFAVLYLGTIPLTAVSVAWAVRNRRASRGAALPTGLACLFFSSATLYVLLAGRNLPLAAYVVLCLVLAYGAFAVVRAMRRKQSAHGPRP